MIILAGRLLILPQRDYFLFPRRESIFCSPGGIILIPWGKYSFFPKESMITLPGRLFTLPQIIYFFFFDEGIILLEEKSL
jgi:hypothetical protein